MVRAVLPWPPRNERRQAIASARRDRLAAERQAAHAQARAQRLQDAVAEDRIAQVIAQQIRQSQ